MRWPLDAGSLSLSPLSRQHFPGDSRAARHVRRQRRQTKFGPSPNGACSTSAGSAVILYRTPQLNGLLAIRLGAWLACCQPTNLHSQTSTDADFSRCSLAALRFDAMQKVSRFNKIRHNSVLSRLIKVALIYAIIYQFNEYLVGIKMCVCFLNTCKLCMI